uniref:Putative ovule protein n=1 Tax=Solanum chacoense TaxID=4108 RepID=A0A0V0H790_SOLCH
MDSPWKLFIRRHVHTPLFSFNPIFRCTLYNAVLTSCYLINRMIHLPFRIRFLIQCFLIHIYTLFPCVFGSICSVHNFLFDNHGIRAN